MSCKAAIVDTSVWIDYFRASGAPEEQYLRDMIAGDTPVYLTPTILQEILQGIDTDADYAKTRTILDSYSMLSFDPVQAAEGAAELYREARKKGVTVRRSLDSLIAWYAIQAELPVLHRDRDFDELARVSALQIVEVTT
mgnify:CR=1 FL=1